MTAVAGVQAIPESLAASTTGPAALQVPAEPPGDRNIAAVLRRTARDAT